MPRDYRAHENARMAKAKRQKALDRNELRAASVPHVSAAGATSAPIKAPDPETAAMVEAFLRKRGQ